MREFRANEKHQHQLYNQYRSLAYHLSDGSDDDDEESDPTWELANSANFLDANYPCTKSQQLDSEFEMWNLGERKMDKQFTVRTCIAAVCVFSTCGKGQTRWCVRRTGAGG